MFINHSLMYIVDDSLKGRFMLLQWGIVLDHRPVRSDGPVATSLLGGGGAVRGYMPLLVAGRL